MQYPFGSISVFPINLCFLCVHYGRPTRCKLWEMASMEFQTDQSPRTVSGYITHLTSFIWTLSGFPCPTLLIRCVCVQQSIFKCIRALRLAYSPQKCKYVSQTNGSKGNPHSGSWEATVLFLFSC